MRIGRETRPGNVGGEQFQTITWKAINGEKGRTMPHYGVRTKLSPEGAVDKAVSYFGEEGLGLEITDRGERCVNFKGGGGHVDIVTCRDKGKTEVDIDTREWDIQVKSFMRQIG
jgi:hypothetical protein